MSIFTKIINREIPANIIYEDNYVIAILDIMPITKGHTLVIPKKEFKDIFEIDLEYMGYISNAILKISKALKKAYNLEGLNILNNNGEISGQSVPHIHFHLIPRYNQNDIEILKNYKFQPNFEDDKQKIIKALS